MLIMEGPDLTGKTTLCKHLVEQLNERAVDMNLHPYVYRHFTRLPDDAWDYYWDYLVHMGPGVIQDRFHISEMVYGPVHKGASRVSHHVCELLQASLHLLGGATILITADNEHIEEMYRNKGTRKEMYNMADILRVNENYRDLQASKPWYFDLHFHLIHPVGEASELRTLQDSQWPTENDDWVNQIMHLYTTRQNKLRTLQDGKPNRHR